MPKLPKVIYRLGCESSIPLRLIAQTPDLSQRVSNASHLAWLQRCDFEAKLGQIALIPNEASEIKAVYVGTGNNQRPQALAHAATLLPPGDYHTEHSASPIEKLYWGMAQYEFTAYKKTRSQERTLTVLEHEKAALEAELAAIFRVRDLINTPSNDMTPEHLQQHIETIAHFHQAEITQVKGAGLLEKNFPAIHAVGRAAACPPSFIHLQWGNPAHPTIALVGKGVCFDSGGLDIKTAGGMRLMKKDMGGAAHAIALAEWIMTRNLPIRLHLMVAAVENAIGPEAYRPGDVLTMRNGLTVEVDNTDAEGRLVLADALCKACEEKPEVIFDFATLTGAARVAVGTEIAALFTNCDTLAQALSQYATELSDPIWRLPLHQAYSDLLQSTVADLLNSAPTSYAGAITAALFLERFIVENQRWAHFDIMAWNVNHKPEKPIGGEAMAIRSVFKWLQHNYGEDLET